MLVLCKYTLVLSIVQLPTATYSYLGIMVLVLVGIGWYMQILMQILMQIQIFVLCIVHYAASVGIVQLHCIQAEM